MILNNDKLWQVQKEIKIMTLEETAKYLKKGKITLYKTAREGKIPTEVTMFIILKDFVCSSIGSISALSADITTLDAMVKWRGWL